MQPHTTIPAPPASVTGAATAGRGHSPLARAYPAPGVLPTGQVARHRDDLPHDRRSAWGLDAVNLAGMTAWASVKWLTEIEVIDSPFTGYFQTKRYIYETRRNGTMAREPVRLQQVRSVITQPSAGQQVTAGDLAVRGVAWSGAAPIDTVEVCIGSGPWQNARLIGQQHRHSWRWWELLTHIDSPGQTTLRARATDLAGHATRPAAREPPRLRRQRHPKRPPAHPVTTVLP
jgi:hypothetical protein